MMLETAQMSLRKAMRSRHKFNNTLGPQLPNPTGQSQKLKRHLTFNLMAFYDLHMLILGSYRNGRAVVHLLLNPQLKILHSVLKSKSKMKMKRVLGTITIHLHTAPTTIRSHTVHMIPLGANLQPAFHLIQTVVSAKGNFLGGKMNSMRWCHIEHPMNWVVCWMPLNQQGNRCNRKSAHYH